MNSLAIGTKVQRKGSKVVWTVTGRDTLFTAWQTGAVIEDKGVENTKQVRLTCRPKNRTTTMSDWIDLDTFNKNWVEVA